MALSIPPFILPAFRELGSLTDGQFEAFLTQLGAITPSIYPTEDVKVGDVPGLESAAVKRIVDALVSLEMGAANLIDRSPANAAKAVAEKVRDDNGNALKPVVRRRLQARIEKAISVQPLRISARAFDLAYANERSLLTSRIITDIRPVFESGTSTKLSMSIVLHRVRMSCVQNGQQVELYVTMDTRDVQTLIDQLLRAQTKEQTLRDALEKAGIAVFDVPPRED